MPDRIKGLADSGYMGLQKLCPSSEVPIKKKKLLSLSREEKKQNRALSSRRVYVENVLGRLKRFKVIAERYRNRRRRFGLRFNLIAGIYNYEL